MHAHAHTNKLFSKTTRAVFMVRTSLLLGSLSYPDMLSTSICMSPNIFEESILGVLFRRSQSVFRSAELNKKPSTFLCKGLEVVKAQKQVASVRGLQAFVEANILKQGLRHQRRDWHVRARIAAVIMSCWEATGRCSDPVALYSLLSSGCKSAFLCKCLTHPQSMVYFRWKPLWASWASWSLNTKGSKPSNRNWLMLGSLPFSALWQSLQLWSNCSLTLHHFCRFFWKPEGNCLGRCFPYIFCFCFEMELNICRIYTTQASQHQESRRLKLTPGHNDKGVPVNSVSRPAVAWQRASCSFGLSHLVHFIFDAKQLSNTWQTRPATEGFLNWLPEEPKRHHIWHSVWTLVAASQHHLTWVPVKGSPFSCFLSSWLWHIFGLSFMLLYQYCFVGMRTQF